jgi:hypothetical protein
MRPPFAKEIQTLGLPVDISLGTIRHPRSFSETQLMFKTRFRGFLSASIATSVVLLFALSKPANADTKSTSKTNAVAVQRPPKPRKSIWRTWREQTQDMILRQEQFLQYIRGRGPADYDY